MSADFGQKNDKFIFPQIQSRALDVALDVVHGANLGLGVVNGSKFGLDAVDRAKFASNIQPSILPLYLVESFKLNYMLAIDDDWTA